MESLDLRVLADALAWRRAGHPVTLVTVVETWGSAPRPPGALLAVRGDGVVSGSVSGGCVEDDLIARVQGRRAHRAAVDDRLRRHQGRGGALRPALRRHAAAGAGAAARHRAGSRSCWRAPPRHELVARTLTLATGEVTLAAAGARREHACSTACSSRTLFGPRWRLLLVGAGQLSQAVAQMALLLDFEVLVLRPARGVRHHAGTCPAPARRRACPTTLVRELRPDAAHARWWR